MNRTRRSGVAHTSLHRRLALLVAAALLGLLPLLLLTSLGGVAQGAGPTPSPTPSKYATPAPTPKGGAHPSRPAAVPPVDYSLSTIAPRGTHGGQRSTYTLVLANGGASAASGTIARASLPANAAYVAGSAAVQGGGALSVSAANVEWHGGVAPGGSVTVTFQVTLPLAVGTLVTNSVLIYDPLAAQTVSLASALRVQAPTGGPDAYGYTYKDSFAAGGPAFNFIAPTITATKRFTPGDDDVFTGPVPLNFNFLFYGSVYTQAFISSNGLVSFGAGDPSFPSGGIPNALPPNNFAACFFNDFIVHDGTQGAWYQTFGAAPNRIAVFTFSMPDINTPLSSPAHPFQTILYETSNKIVCQYADSSVLLKGSGSNAVVGLENADGSVGLQYYADFFEPVVPAGPLQGGMALEFSPGPPALPVFASAQKTASFNVHPSEVVTFTLAVRNSGTADAPGTVVSDPVPSNAVFQVGSASVVGGGVLSSSPSAVQWTGTVTKGQAVTITYQVRLPVTAGSLVTNSATISAPAAALTRLISTTVAVLPTPSGGPDPYGYTYLDSYAPGGPAFGWLTPTVTATELFALGNDDVFTGPLPLNFNFLFYGHGYNQGYVSSNGVLSFLTGTLAFNNLPIPSRADPTDYASCQWSDQIVDAVAQGAWIQTFGTTPNQVTVITFLLGYALDPLTPPPHTFQMILYEATNQVKCQYLQTSGTPWGTGSRSTIGLENVDGAAGLQYFFGLDYGQKMVGPLENGLAVLFSPPPTIHAVFVDSVKSVSEGSHPGEVMTYTLRLQNGETTTAIGTHMDDPFPPGTAYVPNSASATSPGLGVSGSRVVWDGILNPNGAVTVTFAVTLTALSGTVTNTAAITQPLMIAPQVITAVTPVQPYAGGSIGQESFYSWRDRYAPDGPAYSWVPTTPLAIQLFGVGDDDVVTGPLSIPYNFTFYGRSYNHLSVSSNGLVMFNTTGSTEFANRPILTTNSVSNYAACFWLDQVVHVGGGAWIETTGSAPNRRTAITFELTDVNTTTNGPYLYQLILSEGSNRLTCQYQQMDTFERGDGRAATIGIRNLLGDGGVQYYYGNSITSLVGPIENGLAISFIPGPQLFLPVIRR